MADLRRCRWCKRPLTDSLADAKTTPRLRKAHCTHPQCDWCEPCKARREAAIAAGQPRVLDPVPPETDCEQTREIPAVRDEIPPDQMT